MYARIQAATFNLYNLVARILNKSSPLMYARIQPATFI